ncbi:hypothetical protein HNP93_000654 [Methanococcus maripaludis]|uniref:Uncharacterized protein n=1 Tax=Methanococcus maripaludis TaxID=39152 RepID=A0A7J9P422_METMI|nr:hypothetical protein [Methanococcus maripaludis]MBA2857953.1 hypothetical protein [Methanococcus maripaludis]
MDRYLYDENDAIKNPWEKGIPYLTPVFFNDEVLIHFFKLKRFSCEFASETYGFIKFDGGYIPFGINPNKKVIMWYGDIKKFANDDIHNKLISENVESDHDLRSEFYTAQINAEFTDVIKEVNIFQLIDKINELTSKNYGFKLYNMDQLTVNSILEKVSRYKQIMYDNEDDFKRNISELNEYLIESVSKNNLKSFFDKTGIPYDSNGGSLKLLETYMNKVIMDDKNHISPLYCLYDFRIWADHTGCTEKYNYSVSRLGLSDDSSYFKIYYKLIDDLIKFYEYFYYFLIK